MHINYKYNSLYSWNAGSYVLNNISVGQHSLPTPFWKATSISGIRTKISETPLGLLCFIPTWDEEKIVKTFEKKYHIRFTVSDESNLLNTSTGEFEMIPASLSPKARLMTWSKKKYYVAWDDLYSFESGSVQIFVREFKISEGGSSSLPSHGVFVFICRPDWRKTAAEEAFQHKLKKTIDIDASSLDAL